MVLHTCVQNVFFFWGPIHIQERDCFIVVQEFIVVCEEKVMLSVASIQIHDYFSVYLQFLIVSAYSIVRIKI